MNFENFNENDWEDITSDSSMDIHSDSSMDIVSDSSMEIRPRSRAVAPGGEAAMRSSGGKAIHSNSRDIRSNSKNKKRNRVRLAVNIAAPLAIFLCIGFLVGGLFLNSKPFDPGVPIEHTVEVPISDDVKYFLVCGTDESDALTDTMLLLCWDIKQTKANILQIPRDTWVGDDPAQSSSTNKMNSVYGQDKDIQRLVTEIESDFGLHIHHFVMVDIAGFRKIVDVVGGVEVESTIHFAVNERVTIRKGLQTLNGEEAEWFMRLRYPYAEGDMGRQKAQQSFFANFAKQMIEMNFVQMTQAATRTYGDILTDMSLNEALSYAKEARKLKMEDVKIFTMPGEPFYQAGSTVYGNMDPNKRGTSFYSVHKEPLLALLNTCFNPYDDPLLMENLHIWERINQDPAYDNWQDRANDFGTLTGDPPKTTEPQ